MLAVAELCENVVIGLRRKETKIVGRLVAHSVQCAVNVIGESVVI